MRIKVRISACCQQFESRPPARAKARATWSSVASAGIANFFAFIACSLRNAAERPVLKRHPGGFSLVAGGFASKS
jgi:hypothetical protein